MIMLVVFGSFFSPISSSNVKGIAILHQDCTDTCARQDWNFTLSVGVKTFVIHYVKVIAFPRIVPEPDIGDDFVISTIVLD